MYRVQDKPQPEEMCIHDVFEDDPKVYYLQGGEVIRSKEGRVIAWEPS